MTVTRGKGKKKKKGEKEGGMGTVEGIIAKARLWKGTRVKGYRRQSPKKGNEKTNGERVHD